VGFELDRAGRVQWPEAVPIPTAAMVEAIAQPIATNITDLALTALLPTTIDLRQRAREVALRRSDDRRIFNS